MSGALALLLLAQAAPPTQWQRINGDADSSIFVDRAGARRDGDIARVRWRTEYVTATSDGMTVLVMQVAVDCRARTFAFRRMDAFAADGRPLQSFDIPADDDEGGANPFRPGNEEDAALYRHACGETR